MQHHEQLKRAAFGNIQVFLQVEELGTIKKNPRRNALTQNKEHL